MVCTGDKEQAIFTYLYYKVALILIYKSTDRENKQYQLLKIMLKFNS